MNDRSIIPIGQNVSDFLLMATRWQLFPYYRSLFKDNEILLLLPKRRGLKPGDLNPATTVEFYKTNVAT